jgi:hypothetical protein
MLIVVCLIPLEHFGTDMENPFSKRLDLEETFISEEEVREWHEFIATLPPVWFEGKTPAERGREAMKLFKQRSSNEP